MGTALTYARRYALFTLVGIAGEDDVDAHDLNSGSHPRLPAVGNGRGAPETARPRRPRGNANAAHRPLLDPDNSAALRDRLVREISAIEDAERAAHWAHTALAAKNTLTASDARLVQVAFELRLSALEGDAEQHENASESALVAAVEASAADRSAQSTPDQEPFNARVPRHSGRTSSGGIDKSVLSIPEVRRYRDKAHLKFVASHPCLVCGRKPSDPHHLRFAQVRALGRKVSDEFTVPLCRLHHREIHRARNEADWWSRLGIDALGTALKLWKMTRSTNEPALIATSEPSAVAPAVEIANQGKSRNQRAQKRAASGPVDTGPQCA